MWRRRRQDSQRPSANRVNNDARDAEHLSQWLTLVEVVVPSVEQEAARDLARFVCPWLTTLT